MVLDPSKSKFEFLLHHLLAMPEATNFSKCSLSTYVLIEYPMF